ncbi:AAA family ATPase [Kamptonema formosum]|uniref:AAA family ATPase n=1 Tax=Kamptonema formosum TaxID=331992 RepID=UPI000349EE16|nr:AAA family ATPase [Oscillatoria sp. PCC 10802]
MSQATYSKSQRQDSPPGIAGISVRGYKSLYEECSVEIRPLTILAGANSSGKSSIMQPLLLLKQTLEATYDPGPLLLSGPNVRFTSAGQLFSQLSEKNSSDSFSVKIEISNCQFLSTLFKKHPETGIEMAEMTYRNEDERIPISYNMAEEDIRQAAEKLAGAFHPLKEALFKRKEVEVSFSESQKILLNWCVRRNRCFLEVVLSAGGEKLAQQSFFRLIKSPAELFENYIRKVIHVPGLRGNPERTYKITAVGSDFQGTFENYVASVVNQWQKIKDKRLQDLGRFLETLGLTCKVGARQVDDTQVELQVGRLPRRGRVIDMVSVADVGFGVSQVLPVLVALLVAEPGQLVYIEQPEIHLHPRAQAALAEVLAEAASRGVRVVVETHSEVLLLAVQSLVAEGKLLPDAVKLHWFTRREDGVTEVSSADLDEAGAFGDWPEDFGDVSLKLESRYLDAAEARLLKG